MLKTVQMLSPNCSPIKRVQEQKKEEEFQQLEKLEQNLLNFMPGVKSEEPQREEILLEILKLKCQMGLLEITENNTNTNNKDYTSCIQIRQKMTKQMQEFSTGYCFIVLCGVDNELCWSFVHKINDNDKSKYFKVSHKTYNYVVYKINQDITLCEKQQQQLQSKDNIENKIPSSVQQPKQKLQNQNNNNNVSMASSSNTSYSSKSIQSSSTLSMSSSNGTKSKLTKPLQESKISQLQSPTRNLRTDVRRATAQPVCHLKKQIEQGKLNLEKQKMKHNALKEQNPQNKIPTKMEMLQIAKQYKDFIGKEVPTIPFNCKQYADAIYKAFKLRGGVVPRLVIVKKEPQGDYFWDYECENNEGTIHTWDLMKNKKYGVGVCL